jgi:GC-rich sequence DNA-binding factor
MDDAHTEFATLSPILERFGEWKSKYPESYSQAYGTLSLQKICDTFIKQEMLVRWEPFNFPPITFEEYEWFEELTHYLKQSEHQSVEFRANEKTMIQNLITSIVMEPLKQSIMHIYNPFSSRETNLILGILKDFAPVSNLPLVSTKLKEILITANVAIQGYIDQTVILFPPPEKLQQSTIVSSFCYRQFWSAVKLFNNAMLWYKTFTINIVEEMCMSSLLNGKIIPFLRKSASVGIVIESFEKVVKGMTSYLRDSKGIPRALMIFHDFVFNFAKKILENAKQGVSSSTSEKLAVRVLIVLKKLNDKSGAQDLASKFQIKVSL